MQCRVWCCSIGRAPTDEPPAKKINFNERILMVSHARGPLSSVWPMYNSRILIREASRSWQNAAVIDSAAAADKVLPTSRRQCFSPIPLPARCRQHPGVHGKSPTPLGRADAVSKQFSQSGDGRGVDFSHGTVYSGYVR
jgi:hypothetical protein